MFELKNVQIVEIQPIHQVTETFKKQTIVVELRDGRYIDTYAIEAWDDKTKITNLFRIGEHLNISFAIRARKGNDGKYFTNLRYIKHTEVEISTNSPLTTIIENTTEE